MWWFALCFIVRGTTVLKVYKIWLPWLLIYMRIHEIFNVTDGRNRNLVLTFYNYSFSISIYRAWTRLIFSIITGVSHINMLPHQTPGISNQAVVFMRNVKMFTSWTDILVKSNICDNTPVEKWFGQEFLYLETFWRT